MDNFESLYVYNAMTGKLTVNGKPYRSYFVPEFADDIIRFGKKDVRPNGDILYTLTFVYDEHENAMIPQTWL
jgi:hypothetical protein